MLVLTRKPGQAIVIGEGIEVVVVEIKGDQVRLGITATRSIAVHRKEVLEQVRAANQEAAQINGDIAERLKGIFPPRTDRPPE